MKHRHCVAFPIVLDGQLSHLKDKEDNCTSQQRSSLKPCKTDFDFACNGTVHELLGTLIDKVDTESVQYQAS